MKRAVCPSRKAEFDNVTLTSNLSFSNALVTFPHRNQGNDHRGQQAFASVISPNYPLRRPLRKFLPRTFRLVVLS